MKWKRWILTATLLLFIPTKAYAGNINGNEQSVLAVAGGTFEYKGVTYKATSQHLAEARAKMMQDDVDLTPEQAQEAIASIYANVKTGIDEGYIVPISGSSNTDDKNESDKSTQENDKNKSESQENSTSEGKSETNKNPETSVNQQTQNNETNQTTESNAMTGTNVSNQTTEENQGNNKQTISNNQTNENTNNNTQTVQPEEIKEVKTPEQLEWEKTQLPKLKKQKSNVIADNCVKIAKVEQTEETTKEVNTSDLEQTIIKDTSHSLFYIWIVPTIFFIGIGICAMCIIKYHLLAHKHES